MFYDIGKALSFMLSILSLCGVLQSAFFVPGSDWHERLGEALLKIAIAACVCFASGILFVERQTRHSRYSRSGASLLSTLPVRMFFWATAGMAVLFALSWYLEAYYVPLLWRNQP